MAANWKLVQAFVREVTEDDTFQPIADIAIAYGRLRQIQRGQFETAVIDGTVQIQSTIGESSFSFQVAKDLSRAEIIEVAETALQIIEGKSVAEARSILKRRKNTRPDFTGLRL